jgi:imidazolonepropionase-like amidohydrolase
MRFPSRLDMRPRRSSALRRLGVSAVLSAGALLATRTAVAQTPVVIRGGWIFTATGDQVVRNRGILVRGGVFQVVNGNVAPADTAGARVIALADSDYVLPGLIDVHAHYNMTLGPNGVRSDEYTYNPLIFLANGVTTTFPGGEYDPEGMMETRKRIDSGQQIGPRIFNSGPYYGTARRGWNQSWTAEDIYKDVDLWAAQGVRGFKAKGISPAHLKALVERAHMHGLPVTGHLESGFRNSTNARDAVLMGIDRVEHILGGDALDSMKQAYPSWNKVDVRSKEFKDIVALFVSHRVVFDPTITAPVYFGTLREGFDYWIDERKFFTPAIQEWVKSKPPRKANPMFDSLYWAMRRTTKALYDAGGILTLGTDNPSQGEFLAGFSSHRELHTLVLAGIPAAAALRIGTINGARALNAGDKLGSIEPGKFADLFIVRGNPLRDIRNTRRVRVVMKSGVVYDPAELLKSAEGKIGPPASQ